jgi:hypothetical protein
VLGALEATHLPAPRLIAASGHAAEGHPAVLMCRVGGRVDLVPRGTCQPLRDRKFG